MKKQSPLVSLSVAYTCNNCHFGATSAAHPKDKEHPRTADITKRCCLKCGSEDIEVIV